MRTWTASHLRAFDDAIEIDLVSIRDDGTPRPPVPIWAVRVGDDVYVRSWRGKAGAWYRHAADGARLQVRLDGQLLDVEAEAGPADAAVEERIDGAYRAKYGRRGREYVEDMVAPAAQATTLRLLPTALTTGHEDGAR